MIFSVSRGSEMSVFSDIVLVTKRSLVDRCVTPWCAVRHAGVVVVGVRVPG